MYLYPPSPPLVQSKLPGLSGSVPNWLVPLFGLLFGSSAVPMLVAMMSCASKAVSLTSGRIKVFFVIFINCCYVSTIFSFYSQDTKLQIIIDTHKDMNKKIGVTKILHSIFFIYILPFQEKLLTLYLDQLNCHIHEKNYIYNSPIDLAEPLCLCRGLPFPFP